MQEENVVCQLLSMSYEALITTLETIQPQYLTLEYVKLRLLDKQVKRNHRSRVIDVDSSACSAFSDENNEKKFGIKYFDRGKFGHKRTERPDCSAEDPTSTRYPEENFGDNRSLVQTLPWKRRWLLRT